MNQWGLGRSLNMTHIDSKRDWRGACSGDGPAVGRLFDATHPRIYRHATGVPPGRVPLAKQRLCRSYPL